MNAIPSSPSNVRLALVNCGWLTAWTLGLWALLIVPAQLLAGPTGIAGLTYAALLCLVPGWLVFCIGSLYGVSSTQAAIVAIGGSVLRLLSVLFGALVVRSVRSDLGLREFFVWLLVFYMATLLIETLLLLKQQPSLCNRSRTEGS